MQATVTLFDCGDPPRHAEPGLPYFLDGGSGDVDDLNDWWLDLGAVDLTGTTGL